MTTTPDTLMPFTPRGVGLNWLPCFVCGHLPHGFAQADLAAFVDAHRVKMIGDAFSHPVTEMLSTERVFATLDYRPSEPNRVQVKLGACGEHEPNLRLLYEMTAHTAMINAAMVRVCLPGRRLP